MNRAGISLSGLLVLAHQTMREAIRQKVFGFGLVLAASLVLGAQYFREFHFGSPELKFLADVGCGVIALFGAALTVVLMAQLFFSELENRTVLTLLARPVGRAEFVLGKFLGIVAVTAVFCGGLTLVLAGVLWARETALLREFPEALASGRVVNYSHLALVGLLQWLKLMVLGALTLLVASYARTPVFTMAAGFTIYVICHLQFLAREAGTQAGASMATVVAGRVVHVLPNFQLFSLAEALPGGGMLTLSQVGQLALYALGYAGAACGLAVFCFRRREI
jgi:ABC-type transport system involved in multi-copper enzyme maturation permease subunit